jgi:LPS-assembly protein
MINKVSLKYTSALAVSAILFIMNVQSKDSDFLHSTFLKNFISTPDTLIPAKKKNISVEKKLNSLNDTLPAKIVKADSIPSSGIDSVSKGDSVSIMKTSDTLAFKSSKNAPDTTVEYSAEDSMVLDVPAGTVTLYGKKATTQYKDNHLTAPVIEFDQANGNILASIKRDSAGKVISLPTYKQGDFLSQSDSIKFNMKSGKGLTKSTYTQQGEMYVYGEVIKKMDNDVFYALRGRFTTCNLDTPHFAFVSNKIKFINNKVAITGPVHPEFEGIPIPIYFPFGIYPLSQGRHSGLLQPTFTTNQQRGLGLEGLGYYKVVNENWDVIFRGSIYSYGGWAVSINPRYLKRYHYSGSLTFNIQQFNQNFRHDPDFVQNRSFNLVWNHSMDSKAHPGVSFNASVNAGSSSYNRNVSDNPYINFNNQLQSSIAWSKTWKNKNLTITANHNQNTNLKIINVNLPDVAFNLQTLYPFRKKESVGTPKWYENIGIAYNGNAKSLFSFYDTVPQIFKQIADTFQFGAHHSFPISLSLPQIGAFQVGPSVSYEETWYQTKTFHSWDTTSKSLQTRVQKGFYTARQMTFGLGVSTRIFGLITAKNKDAKIQAIRHEITPSLGLSYKPDFNKNTFYSTRIDTAGDIGHFSQYERNVFGPYSPGRFGGLTFGIDNNISMKVKNRKDTGENALKKISIIDGLSINGSYNFFADSFQLSPLSVSARSNLFNKINITANAQLDPYDANGQGQRVNQLLWQRKPLSLGRLTTGNVSLSSSLQGGNKKTGSTKPTLKPDQYAADGYSTDQYNNEINHIRNNPGEYADFNIPWSLNFSYALSFSKNYILNTGFATNFTQNATFGGTLALTPKWQTSLNGYYDITSGKINQVTASISRDLHCWQMSISISQSSLFHSFSINISPKSPLLRDLKVNRTRSYSSGY